MPTVGELRQTLLKNQAQWTVQAALRDDQELPRYTLGGLKETWIPADQVSPIEFERLFAVRPNNPFILQRRLDRGLVKETLVPKETAPGIRPASRGGGRGTVPMGGGAPASVDWRNRWGWPWITTVRDQDGCEACWVFSAVALVEAMVRIEHCVWPIISEGDVHKGYGASCCKCGMAQWALDWIRDHGAADPACFAWPVTSSACSGCNARGLP